MNNLFDHTKLDRERFENTVPGYNLDVGIGVVSALSLIDPLTRVRVEKVNVNG